MYNVDVPFPVYCRECWFGDAWDPLSHGREYDFSRNFFEQYKELQDVVPRLALWQRNAINSDYANMATDSRSVYLSYSVTKESENIFYSKNVDGSKDIVDSLNIISGSEILYENVEGQGNYNCQYLFSSKNCLDSYYLVDCINCSNCFLSYNLRNKKFCIKNTQYTKNEYFKELEKFNLKSRASRNFLQEEFSDIKKKAIYRFTNITQSVNATGDRLLNVKNCKNCFEIYNVENARYCYRGYNYKDSMDFDYGKDSELLYEYITGALDNFNVKFTHNAISSVRDADYTDSCRNCSNILGCISLRSIEYAIFNKKYSKEDFKNIRQKIIQQMKDIPFIDKIGIKYNYGEFFPIELSPWSYNETLAQELAPLTREEVQKRGYAWRNPEQRNFEITITADEIPDDLDEVDENILNEVLGCEHKGICTHQCTEAFRITNYELNFYKKHQIPLPILCPNCRYYERCKIMPELKLYHRDCMCGSTGSSQATTEHFHGKGKCKVEFETTYAPERPEIVYCEKCYQQEVY